MYSLLQPEQTVEQTVELPEISDIMIELFSLYLYKFGELTQATRNPKFIWSLSEYNVYLCEKKYSKHQVQAFIFI